MRPAVFMNAPVFVTIMNAPVMDENERDAGVFGDCSGAHCTTADLRVILIRAVGVQMTHLMAARGRCRPCMFGACV